MSETFKEIFLWVASIIMGLIGAAFVILLSWGSAIYDWYHDKKKKAP